MSCTQLQFQETGRGASQCELIREYLHARVGEWIPMTDLYRHSGAMAVHSRISDLNKPYREAGLRLPYENYTDASSRPHRSFYRYLP